MTATSIARAAGRPHGRRTAALVASAVATAAGAALLADRLPSTAALTRPVWWLVVLAAVAIAVSYLFAAVGLRAAAGDHRLPFGRTVLAQLAAALANRLTPAGIGGAAVNARFLCVSGLSAPAATAAVAAVALANATASVCFACAFLPLGITTGLSHRFPATVALAGVASLVVLAGLAAVARRRLSAPAQRWVRAGADALAALRSDPVRALTVVAGSLGVKAAHAVALIAALAAFDGDLRPGVVVAVYTVGSTLGAALPTPNGLGATEAALIGGLVAAGGSPGAVTAGVLTFRITSFWLPIVPGGAATWTLRRRRML